jgi:VIT1/CCC1 family predicted Fe2+/Mn2+ transporter
MVFGGLLVGLTGALNVGLGMYSSTKAQKQVKSGILNEIRSAIKCSPQIYIKRVTRLMKNRFLTEKTVKSIADEAAGNLDLLCEIIAEEEYGLRQETFGDPRQSGIYSGFFYIIGGIIPLLPFFFFFPIIISIPLSIIIASIMLASTGFVIALAANLSIKRKIFELFIFGLGSSIVTFLLGSLISPFI